MLAGVSNVRLEEDDDGMVLTIRMNNPRAAKTERETREAEASMRRSLRKKRDELYVVEETHLKSYFYDSQSGILDRVLFKKNKKELKGFQGYKTTTGTETSGTDWLRGAPRSSTRYIQNRSHSTPFDFRHCQRSLSH